MPIHIQSWAKLQQAPLWLKDPKCSLQTEHDLIRSQLQLLSGVFQSAFGSSHSARRELNHTMEVKLPWEAEAMSREEF